MTRATDVGVGDLELFADRLDASQAAAIYQAHGCFVVRGLMRRYVASIHADIAWLIDQTLAQIDQARRIPEGWMTPNGALLIPAPDNFERDKQMMCLPLTYQNSAAFFHSALDEQVLDLAEAIIGPDIELYGPGQSLVKEAAGGHPKLLHQDAAYFEHRYDGPLAMLCYVVDTDLNNGALHVVPGSFKLGVQPHEDGVSHLGLNADEWPWEQALPVEGKAGDAIFFHVNCVHGSKPNHSDARRPVFIHRYRRADDYVVIGATTTKNRGEAEKRAHEAKKGDQVGLMVRGSRRVDG